MKVELDSPDVSQGAGTEDIVAPLVVAGDEGTDQAVHNEDNGGEASQGNVRNRQASRKQELKQQERQADEPLDVAHILHRRSQQNV